MAKERDKEARFVDFNSYNHILELLSYGSLSSVFCFLLCTSASTEYMSCNAFALFKFIKKKNDCI